MTRSTSALRRLAWIALIFGIAAACVGFFPLSSSLTKLVFAGGLVSAWLALIVLTWPQKMIRWTLIGVSIAAPVWIALPIGADYDRLLLRQRYVAELEKLEGVDYFWGGENRFGIDCSGLPRHALRRACRNFGENPHLLRIALHNWAFDRSAKALGEEHEGETRFLFSADRIDQMDHSELLPGDLAITASGIHAMCYLGDHRWIEADPGADEVIVVDARDTDIHWFQTEVNLVRWTILDPATNP